MSTMAAASQRVIDVRGLTPPVQHVEVLSSFDALGPGEALLLVSAQDPRPYLDDLQGERKGLFEWSPLDDAPAWRVEITRRSAEQGAFRRVTETLAWDHDRLDGLEAKSFAALGAGDVETARRLYRAFEHGLNRHIRFEEELLFPVFEAKTGLPHAGPTAIMRAEHREIRMLLQEIARSLDAAEPDVDELRDALHRVLGDHNRKEEGILYPATDRLLSDEESDVLVARIQAFPW